MFMTVECRIGQFPGCRKSAAGGKYPPPGRVAGGEVESAQHAVFGFRYAGVDFDVLAQAIGIDSHVRPEKEHGFR
ncbi:hypothetical protein DSECCO2_609010 [anaerobic digester metagenome]